MQKGYSDWAVETDRYNSDVTQITNLFHISTAQLAVSSKQKLQELAKDELLASLSVPSEKEQHDTIKEESDEEAEKIVSHEEQEQVKLKECKLSKFTSIYYLEDWKA